MWSWGAVPRVVSNSLVRGHLQMSLLVLGGSASLDIVLRRALLSLGSFDLACFAVINIALLLDECDIECC